MRGCSSTDGALLRREPPGLEQDALGDPELADVVQQRAEGELLALPGGLEPAWRPADVVGDVLGVPAQERVLGLDRLGEHATVAR